MRGLYPLAKKAGGNRRVKWVKWNLHHSSETRLMFQSTSYRHPSEISSLTVTLLVVAGVVVLTAILTSCLSLLFILVILGIALVSNQSMQKNLMQHAFLVNLQRAPELAQVVEICKKKLQPGPVEVFVVRRNMVNAYTFGLTDPKSIVIYEPLLKIMNAPELAFVLGHEMGHVALGHTLLNTIVGGLAGSPSPYGVGYIMYMIFQRWSRACEYSCDRAGLLACGNLDYAISALVRLAAPNIRTKAEFEQALTMVDAEDDRFGNLVGELFQSHPLIIKRINQLRQYAASQEYLQLKSAMDQNLHS